MWIVLWVDLIRGHVHEHEMSENLIREMKKKETAQIISIRKKIVQK